MAEITPTEMLREFQGVAKQLQALLSVLDFVGDQMRETTIKNIF